MSKALGDDAKWDVDGDELVFQTRVEPTDRWIRTVVAGHEVASSRRAVLHVSYGPPVRPDGDAPELPAYFFPLEDVDSSVLEPAGELAGRRWMNVRVGDRFIENGAWSYLHPTGDLSETDEHITFVWGEMDQWFEEAEEVFEHARDPQHRVDAIRSNRSVEIRFGDQLLAQTSRPTLVFETGLPTRYYVPADDVFLDELVHTNLATGCPYKGRAEYWSVAGGDAAGANIAWSYPNPVAECPKIANLIAFYNEKLNITVDGELLKIPTTPWS